MPPTDQKRQKTDKLVGRKLGNVILKEKIGQGGMGMVYRGWHERFSAEVAVKILPIHPGDKQEQYRERFIREGRAAAKVKHVNVVQVMDAGSDHGTNYLVLEYVNGSSIGDILDSKEKLTPELVERLGKGIAEGLAAIHDQGIVHRDIKPDNILLGRDGVVKITDLGLARQLDDPDLNRLTATGMVVGTPLYVSPEGIRDNKNTSTASDIYGLGATLYHMLAGRPPFSAKTPYEVMRAHLDQRVQPLRELDSSIPKHLATLIQTCLEKDPNRRPDARSVAGILDRSLELVEPPRSRLTILASIAFVGIIIMALLAWQLWFAPGQDPDSATSGTGLRFVIKPVPAELPGKETRLAWQNAEGDWQELKGGNLTLPPGEHRITLKTLELGPTFVWSDTLTVDEGSKRTCFVDLHKQHIPHVSVQLPPASRGIVFCNGKAIAEFGRHITLNHPGHYALGRWDAASKTWFSTEARITGSGKLEIGTWSENHRPEGLAYMTERVDGQAILAHHLCVWREVEDAREASQVATTSSWRRGSGDPLGYAMDMDASLVRALQKTADRIAMRLPNSQEAELLHRCYDNPVWLHDQGSLRSSGGGSGSTALLVLLAK